MPFQPVQIDPHFSPKFFSELAGVDESTILRWFRDMPGVLKVGQESKNGKRTRIEIRIPLSLWHRVYAEKTK